MKFARAAIIPESPLRRMLGEHGFTIANLSQRLSDEGETFEYRMVIRSRDRASAESLSGHLRTLPEVLEFRIAPTGD